MHYLCFDLSDSDDGVTTLEAMASTAEGQHAQVMAEVQQVQAWCREAFAHTQGAVEDGMDWDEDLQITREPGGWHTVTLTLTGSPRFVDAFLARFNANAD